MNGIREWFGRACALASVIFLDQGHAQSAYVVTERGPDYNVLQMTTVENGTNHVHRYTELATGMNYTNAGGQLIEALAQITILPTGGAVANQGRHQVYFPADIYNGMLQVVTPDGRHLRSRPLGVSYDDGSNTVFIATLTNGVGYLTSSNQVTYRNCFAGIKADLVCTYRRAGFESDLVFREQPPTPDHFGLDASATTIQLVTEFFNTADPQAIPGAADEWYGLQDSTLNFGKMKMGQGRAFANNPTNSQFIATTPPAIKALNQAPVYKSWLHLDGRTFLVEKVPLTAMADDLNALPLTVKNEGAAKTNLKMASKNRHFPLGHGLFPDTKQMLLAFADLKKEPGVVLDYNLTLSGSLPSPYYFEPGTTYLINGDLTIEGEVDIEGGAVIKFADGAFWDLMGTLNTLAGDLYPDGSQATLTSKNDNTIGETISGSTGNPGSAGPILMQGSCNANSLHGLKFNYGASIWFPSTGQFDLYYCTFTNGGGFITVNDNWDDNAQSYAAAQTTLHNVDYQGGSIMAEDDYGFGMTVTDATYPLSSGSGGWLSLDVSGAASTVTLQWQQQLLDPDGNPYYDPASFTTSLDGSGRIASPLGQVADGLGVTVTSGEATWGYPSLAGIDVSGLAYNWEMKYFGVIGLSATDLDSLGVNTLGYDYTNGVDPNIIKYTLECTNLYLNSSSANMTVNLTAGVPSYYAVLVNDTNWNDASWQPYTGTNISVSLGSDDGVYVVSVGLKGLPADASQTWASLAFTLDTTPPTLILTNLQALTGSRPFIDPAGYATKALSSLSYSVVDANGGTNSGSGLVVAQGFNQTDPYHVTNWIECLDLPLALGTNQITIQATDLAGNVAVTNFNYVFDTNGDVTPPAISVLWPQSGTHISGNNFTVQGALDDDTATASLQYTDANGILQTIAGLVERGGKLWFKNVPLAAGANSITITATDAAGNMSSTNLNLVHSGVTLTIDALGGDTLNSAYATVTGKVGDPAAAISVNGVPGSNYGSSWEVDNVPLPPGGVVMLVAEAQAMDGTVNETEFDVERQPVVFTQTYDYLLDCNNLSISGEPAATNGMAVNHLEMHWSQGAGGRELADYFYVNYVNGHTSRTVEVTVWPADNGYIPSLPGTQTTTVYLDGGFVYSYTDTNIPPPNVEWMEKSMSNGSLPEDFNANWGQESSRVVKLFTGGRAERQSQKLFDLHEELTKEQYLDMNVPDWGFLYQTGNFLSTGDPAVGVPSAQIALGALGNQDDDGDLWTGQPNDKEIVITPTVAGGSAEGATPNSQASFQANASPPASSSNSAKNINGKLPVYTTYVPSITANSIVLDYNSVAPGANFCVGQGIIFDVAGLPTYNSKIFDVTAVWTLGGTFVNTNSDPNCKIFYEKNPAILRPPQGTTYTPCWYVEGGQSLTASVDVYYRTASDGAIRSLATTLGKPITGKFNVHRPTTAPATPYQRDGDPAARILTQPQSGLLFLSLGLTGQAGDMSFMHQITTDGFCSGQVGYEQLITSAEIVNADPPHTPLTGTALDNALGEFPRGTPDIPANTTTSAWFCDGPNAGLPMKRFPVTEDISFSTYLMFRPIGGIWVPLRRITWELHDSATYSPTGWNAYTSGTTKITGDDPSTEFPHWSTIW